MTKVQVLQKFHGADYSEVFNVGETHYLEDARAQSLALRGLVKLAEEKTEEPSSAESPKHEEEVEEQPKTEDVGDAENPSEEQASSDDAEQTEQTSEEAEEKKTRRGRRSAE